MQRTETVADFYVLIMKRELLLATALSCAFGCASVDQHLPSDQRMIREAEIAVDEERFDDAVALYQRIEREFRFESARSAVRVGDIRLLQGRRDAAIAAYKRAVQLYPQGSMRYGAYHKLKGLIETQKSPAGNAGQ